MSVNCSKSQRKLFYKVKIQTHKHKLKKMISNVYKTYYWKNVCWSKIMRPQIGYSLRDKIKEELNF